MNVTSSASAGSSTGDEIDLLELWTILREGMWIIIGVTASFIALSVTYALTATEWYRADVLLSPTDQGTSSGLSGQLGDLGGLAGLVGVNLGGDRSTEALAVLQSRDFTGAFIEDQGLLSVLFRDRWDPAKGEWENKDPKEWPDVRDAVKYFDEEIRSVNESRDTGLVTLAIEWTDAEVAAEWANLLVERLNDRMRSRALAEAEANVKYLEGELAATNILTLQQSVSRLLEGEMQKLMLARGNAEFAYRMIDRAQVPMERSRPKRTLIVLVATIAGAMLAIMIVFFRRALMRARSGNSASRSLTRNQDTRQ